MINSRTRQIILGLEMLLVSFIFSPAIAQDKALFSWWNGQRGDNFATTDPRWSVPLDDLRVEGHHIKNGKRKDGYTLYRVEGVIFDPNAPRPANTVPLYSWWNAQRGDNFATTNPNWIGSYRGRQTSGEHVQGGPSREGYSLYRLEGYLYDPDKPHPAGTVPVYSWWNPERKDNFLTTNPEWRKRSRAVVSYKVTNGRTKEGYRLYRLEGYAKKVELPDATPLPAGLPLQSSLMERHPRLAPIPLIHFDHFNSSVTDLPAIATGDPVILHEVKRRRAGRLGLCLNFMLDPLGNLLGFCGDPDGLLGLTGVDFDLVLFNNETFDTLQEMHITEVPGTGDNACNADDEDRAPLNLGYFVMDNLGRVIFANENNIIKFVGVDLENQSRMRTFRQIDMTSKVVPGMEASFRLRAQSHQIAQIMPDYTDGYWFTGTGNASHAAFIGHINASNEIDFFHAFTRGSGQHERIENGVAIDSTGIYVLTDFALYKFHDAGPGGQLVFSRGYTRATSCKPGTLAHFGSGSTPTLLGDDLVAFTDNADDRVNVVVLDRTDGGRGRQICRQPVFASGKSANENTLIGYENSIMVQNWWGAPDKTNGPTTELEPGFWRIDVNDARTSCSVVWRNEEVGGTATSRLSTRTGLIYMAIENWEEEKLQLAFIDFQTGSEVRPRFTLGDLSKRQRLLSPSPNDDQVMMMPTYIVPGGRVVQPVFDGMRILKRP